MRHKQRIQIGRNVTNIIKLPCVRAVEKQADGTLFYLLYGGQIARQGNFHPERRLGCMCCPLASKKQRMAEFKAHPQMAKLYIKGAQRFLDTHPDSKNHRYFKDACELFAYTLYCNNLEEFRYKFGENMFGESIDCKQHLSELFGIDL